MGGFTGGEPARWYVSVNGQTFGPADEATLREWAAAGRLPPHAQVAPVGNQTWLPITGVPELQSLPFPGPPRAAGQRLPPTVAQLAPCPRCGGPVVNETPAYGLIFGIMEKSILPRLRCRQCGTSLKVEGLAEPYRSDILRTKRRTLIIWIAIAIPAMIAFG